MESLPYPYSLVNSYMVTTRRWLELHIIGKQLCYI